MFHYKLSVSISYVLFFILDVTLTQSADDLCETPRKEEGRCILLKECPPILDILKNRPISPEDADYLKRSGCGFVGLDSKVCCPVRDKTQPTSTTALPDGQGSRLLPGVDVCGISAEDRIIGGEIAALSDFPWMVLIEYQTASGRGFYCGGVLINDKYVLTAAHCLKGKDLPASWRLVSVRLGEYDTDTAQDCVSTISGTICSDPPIDVSVIDRIAHEDYDPYSTDQYHDIALLRLSRSVNYTDYIRPICMPTLQDHLTKTYEGTSMFVAGWGKTESRSASNVKLKLRIKVKTNNECAPIYRNARVNIGGGQLCAGGEKGKDSCRGDSGGALMVSLSNGLGNLNWYAMGVVSFGPSPCGMEGWPGVYTRVNNYVNWISRQLKP